MNLINGRLVSASKLADHALYVIAYGGDIADPNGVLPEDRVIELIEEFEADGIDDYTEVARRALNEYLPIGYRLE